MKKVLIALLIIIVLYVGLVIYTNNNYDKIVSKHEGNYTYEYRLNKYVVTVSKYHEPDINCIKDPCGEKKLRMIYTIPLTKSYKEKIENIKKDDTVKYEVIASGDNGSIKQKGYTIDPENDIVSIYLGEKNTGGHTIEVKNVRINNDKKVFIEIEEKTPEAEATMAFTEPYIKIKFEQDIETANVSEVNGVGIFDEISEGNE